MVDQRLRDDNGIVDGIAVEPIITLLLEDDAPWRSGEYAQGLLRAWLRGHVLANTAAGNPLRILLRKRLVEACAAADRRLDEALEAEAAARAARTPEEVEKERRYIESNSELFSEIGYGDRHRRRQPKVPREVTDEIVLELLALLGPDLGDTGEGILSRVAHDAPGWLAPVVEEFLTGRALASYRPGLLAQLTEAYYIDERTIGLDVFEDGVRHHRARNFVVTPQYAWYRGPFMALLQADFHASQFSTAYSTTLRPFVPVPWPVSVRWVQLSKTTLFVRIRPNSRSLVCVNATSAMSTFGSGIEEPESDHIHASAHYKRWSECATNGLKSTYRSGPWWDTARWL